MSAVESEPGAQTAPLEEVEARVGASERELGARIGSLLSPGMTAAVVGGNVGYFAPLNAEKVG